MSQLFLLKNDANGNFFHQHHLLYNQYFLDNDKYVASICGGPTIFSYNNLANGAKLTGHSAVKEELSKNHIYVDVPTHVDGKIITGVGAGQAINFAFKIAEQFFDKEKIEEVKKGMEII